MSVWSNLDLMEKEGQQEEIRNFYSNVNFVKKYDRKVYDKQNFEHVWKFIKNAKLVISRSWKNKLAGNEVLVKVFMTIRMYKKLNCEISKNDLVSQLGFKKTTLNLAIKKLVDLGLVDGEILREKNVLKLKKINLRNKGENYVVIRDENAMKILLLNGLKAAWYFVVEKYKSKALAGKKFIMRKGDKKVMLQNGFYDDMSRSGVFRMHNAFAELLGFRVKQIYQVVRGVEKKFICLKNKLGQAFRKFVGYGFKCERYLIMKF
ncbi:hypothetical protein NXS15_03400 [Mycoplasma sp. CSL7475-4]|uniref:MAGa4850 family ICE element protein n=1 Tax=Mycoplasma sp. CSL7475-4 TaxID=2973942 RepID=UPI00216B3FD7|nr:hypothetical protein [Mycoplasma sp. CSL7475-4]MCS4537158.1 hypothetical protein [Mycoplasma sp. CSL7475-4]